MTLLRKLPFFDESRQISVKENQITLKPHRILVWIAFCKQGPIPYDDTAPFVPAILDTGFNGDFCIREEQMRIWGGVDPRLFPKRRTSILPRGAADLRAANLWLHHNVAMSTDPTRDRPFRFEVDEGIHVFRERSEGNGKDPRPELPLLGMRALRRHGVVLTIDYRSALVNLNNPRYFHWNVSL